MNDFAVNATEFFSEDYKVTGFYWDDENEILDVEIGEVCLSTVQDMPFEIEINGVIYERKD